MNVNCCVKKYVEFYERKSLRKTSLKVDTQFFFEFAGHNNLFLSFIIFIFAIFFFIQTLCTTNKISKISQIPFNREGSSYPIPVSVHTKSEILFVATSKVNGRSHQSLRCLLQLLIS